jgi:hypothetical protein
MSIETFNVHSRMGLKIKYCRPFANGEEYHYEYYVDPLSEEYFELGTLEFPFKNFDPPSKEILNFMYSSLTNITTFIKTGTSMYFHEQSMPHYSLNLKMFKIISYGDIHLPNPIIYLTDIPY